MLATQATSLIPWGYFTCQFTTAHGSGQNCSVSVDEGELRCGEVRNYRGFDIDSGQDLAAEAIFGPSTPSCNGLDKLVESAASN